MQILCTTVSDPDVFFPDTPEQLAYARSLCQQCPAASACLAEAIAVNVSDGVWGGQLFERGQRVAEKRRPGRPRKSEPAAGLAA